MKISLRELRRLILEYKANPGSTLYHRSNERFKVGDILTPQKDKSGKHWLEDKDLERDLERYRKDHHPDLPSRFDCVYASFIPRSRFKDKGYLYAVKPIGRMHVADSKVIDYLHASHRDYRDQVYYIEKYWDEVHPSRSNLANLEILMDKAEVIEVVEEPNRVQRGDLFIIDARSPKIVGEVMYTTNRGKKDYYVTPSSGKGDIPKDIAEEELQNAGCVLMGRRSSSMDGWYYRDVELRPGFKGIVVKSTSTEPRAGGEMNYVTVVVSPGDEISDDSGAYIRLDIKNSYEFVKAVKNGSIRKI